MNALRLLALSCCSLVVITNLYGQVQPTAATQQGVITVTGTAEMTKQPEIIRVQFKQYGKGNDQEAAKAALVAVEKKLLTKLGEAGAEVIVANAGMSLPSQNLLNRYRNVSSMIMQRQMQLNGGGGNQPDKSNNITYLERYLTVDLKPKSKTREPLVLLADLQEKLRKDYQELSGMADALPKDDNNDVNNNTYVYRNDSSMFTTDVRFQIAAKITREDRVKLYGDAMKRARAIATDLAEAAEMKAGAIQNINSNFTTLNNVYNYGGTQRAMNSSGELAKFPFTLKEDGSEAVAVREMTINYQSSVQEPLTYGVSLTASFKLEGGSRTR
ncbi:MAG: SIMPL domain-containing protein [Gemmatales bacterium]